MTTEEKIADLEDKVNRMSHGLAEAFELIEAQATHINTLYQNLTNVNGSLTKLMNDFADHLERLK